MPQCFLTSSDVNSADTTIQNVGTSPLAGSTGEVADAGHVHAFTGEGSNLPFSAFYTATTLSVGTSTLLSLTGSNTTIPTFNFSFWGGIDGDTFTFSTSPGFTTDVSATSVTVTGTGNFGVLGSLIFNTGGTGTCLVQVSIAGTAPAYNTFSTGVIQPADLAQFNNPVELLVDVTSGSVTIAGCYLQQIA